MSLDKFKRNFEKEMFNVTIPEAISKRICIRCKKLAVSFTDKVSAKEYTISGFCQTCQDNIF